MGAMDAAMRVGLDCCRGESTGAPPSARFFCTCAALFVASAAGTVVWGASMAAMGDMPMGGWTMSMMWMRMPDQTWASAAASFMGMWTLMMVAMMLPALVPMLWRYRRALFAAEGEGGRLGVLGLLVGAAYLLVWAAQGAAVYPLGVALAAAAMRWPAIAHLVPFGVGMVVLAAGALQFSPWKLRHLACCRGLRPPPRANTRTAWRHGVRLGLHCGACCAGLTAVLLVTGVMDLTVMAAVTAAITAERLFPRGAKIARAIGALLVATGLSLLTRAAWAY